MNIINVTVRVLMITAVVGSIYLFLMSPRFMHRLWPQKSINVLAWPNILDASQFAQFEQETGIQVYLTFFENYEELIVKMRSGAGDYDLIMVSDYAVNILLKENLVKPLDKSQLTFWKKIYPAILNLDFDPENIFTIPFAWEIYGIGVDTTFFDHKIPPATWKLLFEKQEKPFRVGMLDDAREIISIAALYLFGKKHPKELSPEDLDKIEALLLKQKSWVTMYTDLRIDYMLASQSAPVVMGISSDIFQAMREFKNIFFLIPEEGSFIVIDNFMIPASTIKDDLVYQFLNFLYSPEILGEYADTFNFFPVRPGVASKGDRYKLTPTKSLFNRLSFFNYVIPEERMRSLWITLKS